MLKRFLFGLIIAAGFVATSHAAGNVFASLASDKQGVKVTVAPLSLDSDAQSWAFEVTLETHVRDLADDITRASLLVADGIRYAPIDWTGAPPSGHHRKGSLRFTPIKPYPSLLELQIHLEGETAPRTFRWTLKGTSHGN